MATKPIHPRADTEGSVGTSAFRWEEVFVSGDISDGTNAKTMAEIAAFVDADPVPGGANTEIQFNNSTVLDGDANLTWDDTNKHLAVIGGIAANVTSFPANPIEGLWCYRTNRNILYRYEDSWWQPQVSFTALTLYVDPAGTDTDTRGFVSGVNAVATVKYCWENVIPRVVGGEVTVNIAAGTYTEEHVFSFKSFAGDYFINFEGELTNAVTGTADADSTTSVLEDDGASWAGDQTGKLLILTGGTAVGEEKFIRANDADSLNPGGLFATSPDATTTYGIYDLGTIFQPGAGLTAVQITGQTRIRIKYIDFDTSKYGLLVSDLSANIEVYSCEFDGMDTNGVGIWALSSSSLKIYNMYSHSCARSGLWVTGAGQAELYDSLFVGNNTVSHAQHGGIAIRQSAFVLMYRSYIDGNNIQGVYCSQNATGQFLSSAANESTITNHDTAGDFGVRVVEGSQITGVTGQDYPVGTNDTDYSADAATFAIAT